MEPRYPFVAVDVPEPEADEIAAALFELGASGVEQRDEQTLVRGARSGQVTLVASFEDHGEAQAAIAALGELSPPLAARLEEVVGDAWRDAWKEHFAPFALTPTITVVPPWIERAPEREGERVLLLEPGRAFGTGLHATTALVAELLDEHAAELRGRELLDVGTGSGILALVALLLGAERAVAIDNDDDVIEVVHENAARNGLEGRIEASAGVVEQVTRRFPWVVANIEARVLRPLAPELARVLAPGGWLILSGILESERDDLVARYTSLPLAHVATRPDPASGRGERAAGRGDAGGEGWVALLFRAPGGAAPAAG
ncbi:50S ribosomal protein L11 methyltransferase [Sorangium cellulosum]|uniref:Ribosomal protein L11 methyltransferase n=3 Tax=Sorangium cellulosum TaxID=56 RepID=A0A150TZZ2_SORCE|nr:50S ribosomal protein L11 methyltransferase [Sorangium cellulosum]AGP40398.1 ribosomal protein L11 methyltransferase [Sorangium cellulosum So0157-2]KYG10260.1 ribosomal protein L11 methyltransferase [Sorangium cellulosum]